MKTRWNLHRTFSCSCSTRSPDPDAGWRWDNRKFSARQVRSRPLWVQLGLKRISEAKRFSSSSKDLPTAERAAIANASWWFGPSSSGIFRKLLDPLYNSSGSTVVLWNESKRNQATVGRGRLPSTMHSKRASEPASMRLEWATIRTWRGLTVKS